MLTLLFDGIAYGMLLFVLAVGLAVTLDALVDQEVNGGFQAQANQAK